MPTNVGVGLVTILPETAGFSTKLRAQLTPALDSATKGLSAPLTKQASAIGSALTVGLTLPLGIAAAAATKFGYDWDKAFTRIAAVTNTGAANIAVWKEQVLDLAKATGQAPQELADALYFLASAGLKAGTEIKVLDQAAKASAVGLGDTADVARVTAQALNAYATSGLTATQVTDALVEAVKVGTAEPQEFADALGRVLPIAAKAGVTFADVTASLASLSNIGLDVDEGVTALRGVLTALVAPGGQAANALHEVGISVDEMRSTLAQGGVLAALQLLQDRTNGDIDVLRKVIPNVRALTGALGLSGQSAETAAANFDQVKNSAGALGEAYATVSGSPSFKIQQSFATIQATLVELGSAILPRVASAFGGLASLVGKVGDAFTQASPGVQDLVVQIGTFAIAAGPAILVITKIITLGQRVTGALRGLSAFFASTTAVTVAMGAEAVATTAAAEAMTLYVSNASRTVITNHEVAASAGEVAVATGGTAAAGLGAIGVIGGLAFALVGLASSAAKATREMNAASDAAAKELTDKLRAGELQVSDLRKELENLDRVLSRPPPKVPAPGVGAARAAAEERAAQLRAALRPVLEQEGLQQVAARNREAAQAVLDQAQAQRDLAAAIEATRFDRALNQTTAYRKALDSTQVVAAKLGLSFADLKGQISQIIDSGDQAALDSFMSGLREKAAALQQEITAAFDVTGSVLSDLAGKANLTGGQIATALEKPLKALDRFQADWKAASKSGVEGSGQFLQAIGQMGLEGGNILHAFAGANEDTQRRIVKAYDGIQSRAQSLGTQISKPIVDAVDKIGNYLALLIEQLGAVPDKKYIDLYARDHAIGVINGVRTALTLLDGSTATVYIRSQTSPGQRSPGAGAGYGAAGGILGAAGGAIFTEPTMLTPRLLVAEGGGRTNFGKGAEALLPLTEQAYSKMGAGIAKHMPGVTVQVNLNGPVYADRRSAQKVMRDAAQAAVAEVFSKAGR